MDAVLLSGGLKKLIDVNDKKSKYLRMLGEDLGSSEINVAREEWMVNLRQSL